MLVTIYGASDDLVEVAGCEGADEFSSDDWAGDLIAPDGSRMRVYARYGEGSDGACWSVGVSQYVEGCDLPGWPVSVGQAKAMNPDNPGYSATLVIDVPEGTQLTSDALPSAPVKARSDHRALLARAVRELADSGSPGQNRLAAELARDGGIEL